ncbi:GNAT family N-acetyltransferase [Macrococcoides caseolyticum]|uniref:GNAT family N-acetyltransferase n=1 Tax=Macrococcoides caseolyticum TaxID=69966 RepID=UPI001F258C75|nr:GNAT family N-acetyltransferase [Macrococcus caseolyticus]MCE4955993.1 GNAT family N-acetyltransferase [Macrococcus caseolyticus]
MNNNKAPITFKDTKVDAELFSENERYKHYHTPSQLIKYYANYFEYKVMPDVKSFIEDYHVQRAFHDQYQQKHALFIFPENNTLSQTLIDTAQQYGFGVEKMELYLLEQAPETKATDIEVVQVVTNDDVFKDFLEVCREGDLEYGEEFADLKALTHRRDLHDETVLQFVGYQHGFPAGKIEAIESEAFIEVDDFYVLDAMRKQGVGTSLQQAIWQYAGMKGKQVILIADGNDSPREMYQKQGYIKVSERYELLRKPSADEIGVE